MGAKNIIICIFAIFMAMYSGDLVQGRSLHAKPLLTSLITIDIYNLRGDKVMTTKVSDMSQVPEIYLPNGVYFAKVRGQSNFKFMVK